MNNEGNSPVSMDDVARYFGVPVSLVQPAAPSALSNAEMIAALTEVHSWARDLPIPTPGTISAMQKVRAVRDALAAAPVAAQAGQVAVPEMTDEQIVAVWQAMPGGPDGWLKQFGYLQFARALLAAAPSAPAVAQQAPAQAEPIPAEPIECWSHNEEDFNARSLGELIDDHELQPGVTVWVGEAVHPEPKSLFNTDWLIESMGEAAYDIGGEHAGEDYPNVSDEQVAELEALIVGWIAKYAPPNFWTVKDVRAYVLTAEDCGAQASTPDVRQEGGAA